jgi:hypothetical protein
MGGGDRRWMRRIVEAFDDYSYHGGWPREENVNDALITIKLLDSLLHYEASQNIHLYRKIPSKTPIWSLVIDCCSLLA